jgi:hypothetical protein
LSGDSKLKNADEKQNPKIITNAVVSRSIMPSKAPGMSAGYQ